MDKKAQIRIILRYNIEWLYVVCTFYMKTKKLIDSIKVYQNGFSITFSMVIYVEVTQIPIKSYYYN